MLTRRDEGLSRRGTGTDNTMTGVTATIVPKHRSLICDHNRVHDDDLYDETKYYYYYYYHYTYIVPRHLNVFIEDGLRRRRWGLPVGTRTLVL